MTAYILVVGKTSREVVAILQAARIRCKGSVNNWVCVPSGYEAALILAEAFSQSQISIDEHE